MKFIILLFLIEFFCKKCYERWISHAYRYIEDIPYEERNFEFYAKQLNLL